MLTIELVDLTTSRWYRLTGRSHRLNGPSMICCFLSGKKHKVYHIANGLIHCDNGPAIIIFHSNGTLNHIEYRKNDALHRINGPAIKTLDIYGNLRREEYWNEGMMVGGRIYDLNRN